MAVLIESIANLISALSEVELDRKWYIIVGAIIMLWWNRPRKFAKAFTSFSTAVIIILILLDNVIKSISQDDDDQ